MTMFFISYNKADEAWARWVDEVLRGAGHETIVMFRDFRPGQIFTREMHKALRACDGVVVLLSPRSLASDWVEEE